MPCLKLGQGRDLATERGVECPGDLPAPSDPGLVARARAAKAALADSVFVLGHHYQRDEVIEFADVTGDSFKLAQQAAARPDSPSIVFCGVHFMAESADILTSDQQTVILPDLAAGCSMADMALIPQVEDAWDELLDVFEGLSQSIAERGAAGHLHELVRRHQGVHRPARRDDLHVLQRQHCAEVGVRPDRRRRRPRARCCSCPTSTSAATRLCASSACPSTTACSGTRTNPTAASPRSSCVRPG
jgi:hypothetical protein